MPQQWALPGRIVPVDRVIKGYFRDRRRDMHSRGYSLVELLICVALTALLGSLAVSGFSSAWLHARRSDAVAALLGLQLAEERFFSERGRYAIDLTELYAVTGAAAAGSYYRLSASSPGTDQYRLEATAMGLQTLDRADCLRLAVNQSGERLPPEPSSCWR